MDCIASVANHPPAGTNSSGVSCCTLSPWARTTTWSAFFTMEYRRTITSVVGRGVNSLRRLFHFVFRWRSPGWRSLRPRPGFFGRSTRMRTICSGCRSPTERPTPARRDRTNGDGCWADGAKRKLISLDPRTGSSVKVADLPSPWKPHLGTSQPLRRTGEEYC